MSFSAWQIDKLIRGLHAYRVMKAKDGRLAPWKLVHQDLLFSEKTATEFPKGGAPPSFKEEALRRFANGESTLQPDKLEDVWLFLIDKGVLGRNELEESGGEALLAEAGQVHARLAAQTDEAKEKLRLLAPRYRATRRMSDGTEEIALSFVSQPGGGMLAVTEQMSVARADGRCSIHERKDGGLAGRYALKGYAFITPGFPTLQVFLRGPAKDDFIHYVRVGNQDAWQLPTLTLVRTGDAPVVTHTGTEQEQIFSRYNILRFSPTEQAGYGNPKITVTKVEKVQGVRA